jgi:hypothetical protein
MGRTPFSRSRVCTADRRQAYREQDNPDKSHKNLQFKPPESPLKGRVKIFSLFTVSKIILLRLDGKDMQGN